MTHQGGKTSAASKNAWNGRNYDEFKIMLPKGSKATIKAHAIKHYGGSVTALFRAAVAAQIARDEQTKPAAAPDASGED